MYTIWFFSHTVYDSTQALKGSESTGGNGKGMIRASREGTLKTLKSPEINSEELIPPAFVAWQAGMTTLFLLGS
jgi:hypothetical protein